MFRLRFLIADDNTAICFIYRTRTSQQKKAETLEFLEQKELEEGEEGEERDGQWQEVKAEPPRNLGAESAVIPLVSCPSPLPARTSYWTNT